MSIEQALEAGQVVDHVIRCRTLVAAKRGLRVGDTSGEPGRAHANPRSAADVGFEVVTDVDHVPGIGADPIEHGFEDFRARFADPDLVRDHDQVEVLEQAGLCEHQARGLAVAEVRADGERHAPVQAREQRRVVAEMAHVLANRAHVRARHGLRHLGLRTSDPPPEGQESLQRRQLAVLRVVGVAQLAVARAELRGKSLEFQTVPLHTGGVKKSEGRRRATPRDLDAGKAVHVHVDERVEKVDRECTDRHAAQDSRVRWIVQGENLDVLRALPDALVDLVYIDPPFNTGRTQRRTRLRVERVEIGGDRTGFAGRRYESHVVGVSSFDDRFEDFPAFLEPRLVEARRVLKPTGSLFVHLDPRESHYVKVLLDRLFGRSSFMNEIVWAYDYGARSRTRWPAKHDTILWYAMDPARFTYEYDAIDRIPYAAPGLVGPEKAARGKTPTDVWWQTIVPTNSRERTGYATQKPLAILSRIVAVHSRPGDLVLDFFAGSGTTGEAAARLDRGFILVDSSPDAVRVMTERLAFAKPKTLTSRQLVGP